MALLTKRSFRRSLLVLALILAECAVVVANAAENKTRVTREYDLKATFLFQFARFVEWPPESLPAPGEPFVIGVIGDDPFGKSLDEVATNELIRGHEIVVRRYRDVEDLDSCHVLYISSSETQRLDRIFDALKGKSILTVGETDGFGTRAGIIRFLVVQNKLRLRINLDAAREANLTISSQLLRQAETTGAK